MHVRLTDFSPMTWTPFLNTSFSTIKSSKNVLKIHAENFYSFSAYPEHFLLRFWHPKGSPKWSQNQENSSCPCQNLTMPLLTAPGRLQKLSTLPQVTLKSPPSHPKSVRESLKQSKLHASPNHCSEFHIPYEKLTITNVLPIRCAQYQTERAS